MSEAWQPRTVGESVRITKGVTYASSDYGTEDDGHVFLTIKCFAKGGGFNTEGIKYFRGVYLPEQEIAPGELLIAKTDLTRDGDIIGSPMIAPDFGEGKKALPSMDLSVLRAMDGDTDLPFLFYRLMLGDARRFMWAHSAGSTVLHLESKALPKFAFSAPKHVEQRRIAEILSTLDEAIERTEALIAKHQQIKAGLMHDLFTRGVTPDGHLRPTREQAPDLYKESPLGWIPEEWEVVTTEDCASKAPGSTTIGPFGSDLISSDYRSEGVPVAFVRDVKEDAFEWNSDVFVTHEKAQRLSAHAVRPGDLLSTKMGFPPCVTCEYPNWMVNGIITADIIRLRPDPARVNTRWLSAALNSDTFKRQVQAITAGVTRPKVTLSDFRKLRLARPELDEQTMFSSRLASLADLSSSEETKLAKLHKQKHGLMHDLLTGHVRVKFSEKRVTRG